MASVNITRRSFVCSAACTAAIVSAGPALALAPQRLHGDGIHDDTDALEALFAGQPVVTDREALIAQRDGANIRLLNGKFLIRRPVRIRKGMNLYSANCSFRVNDGAMAPYPILTNT